MRRGEIWTAAGGPGYAGKPRPVVIVQDDRFDATHSVTICGLTTIQVEASLARVSIMPSPENQLVTASWLMVDKLVTIPRGKLGRRVGHLNQDDVMRLDRAIMVFLGLSAG